MTVSDVIRGRMRETHIDPARCARAAGMSVRTLQRRMADPDGWTAGELREVVNYLGIQKDMITEVML